MESKGGITIQKEIIDYTLKVADDESGTLVRCTYLGGKV